MNITIEYPTTSAPENKKWWWRPTYFSQKMGLNEEQEQFVWHCAFCGKVGTRETYQQIEHICECGAVFVKPYGQCGLVDKNYNQTESWN